MREREYFSFQNTWFPRIITKLFWNQNSRRNLIVFWKIRKWPTRLPTCCHVGSSLSHPLLRPLCHPPPLLLPLHWMGRKSERPNSLLRLSPAFPPPPSLSLSLRTLSLLSFLGAELGERGGGERDGESCGGSCGSCGGCGVLLPSVLVGFVSSVLALWGVDPTSEEVGGRKAERKWVKGGKWVSEWEKERDAKTYSLSCFSPCILIACSLLSLSWSSRLQSDCSYHDGGDVSGVCACASVDVDYIDTNIFPSNCTKVRVHSFTHTHTYFTRNLHSIPFHFCYRTRPRLGYLSILAHTHIQTHICPRTPEHLLTLLP